jgi:hypothetical protein
MIITFEQMLKDHTRDVDITTAFFERKRDNSRAVQIWYAAWGGDGHAFSNCLEDEKILWHKLSRIYRPVIEDAKNDPRRTA